MPVISGLRQQRLDTAPGVLADALRDEVNLSVWQRPLPDGAARFARALLASGVTLAESHVLERSDSEVPFVLKEIAANARHLEGWADFIEDVTWLVELFAYLLGTRRLGLRLRRLDKPMCPRFHVDQVALRLITTYAGPASEWRETHQPNAPIRQLQAGDVALFKGERWEGNEGGGILHRSPAGGERLLLTLDWLD